MYNVLENKDIDEKVYMGKSKEGINIYYIPKRGYQKQFAIFSTNYGSIDNSFVPIGEKDYLDAPEGIAHFLEHKLFEDKEDDIFDRFSEMGMDVNAFTSFSQTSYVFTSTEDFYEGLELLVKFVQSPHFTDENVEKEKGIIEQEIKMYEDSPSWRVLFNLLNAMYKENPVKYDIAGTVDSINEIDKELLYKAYNTFYNPENMVLTIVGDLDVDKIFDVVNKTEKKFAETLSDIDRRKYNEPETLVTNYVEEEMSVVLPLFYIGYKDREIGLVGKDKIKKDYITNILIDILFSSSSKFYQKLYDMELIDLNFGAYYDCEKTYSHTIIYGQSENPEEVYQMIKDYIKKESADIITKSEFTRIKNKYIGQFIMSFNSVEGIAVNFVDNYYDGVNLFDVKSIIEEITIEDVRNRLVEHLDETYSAISIILPKEDLSEVY